MKRLILTLITLLTVSFANAQIITDYKMVANENGLLFRAGEVSHLASDTLQNENYSVDDYAFSYTVSGPVTVYDIYGHIKKHISDAYVDLDILIYDNRFDAGTYIIAPYGYKAFRVFNGHFLIDKAGKFTPVK